MVSSAQPPLFALDVYHLAFDGPVKVDPAAPGIPSDALFAALTAAWQQARGDSAVSAWWKPFREGRPPFVLTSAFPYVGRVRFYPWPPATRWLWPPHRRGEAPGGDAWTTARFFSAGILALALQGRDPTAALMGAEARQMQQGALRLTRAEWREKLAPAVQSTISWTVTHDGRVAFAEGAGLWFGVWWCKEGPATLSDGTPWRTAWQTALETLAADNPWGAWRCPAPDDASSPRGCQPLLRPVLPQVVRGPAYLLSRCAPSDASAVPLAVHPVPEGAPLRWDAGSLVVMPGATCGRVVEGASGPVYGYGLGLPWPA